MKMESRMATTSFFDTAGRLVSNQQFYYDLRVGSHVEYKNEKPSAYYFTSFDNGDLFHINYDSIYNKEIGKLNDGNFFFWHINPKVVTTKTDKELERNEGFIYIINPPRLNFEYSLCIINNKDSILKVEKQFDKTKIWDTFILDPEELRTGERFTFEISL
jgi:hypothetical protein